MDYFALIYDVVDDFVARRAPLREAHLRHASAAHDRGEIVLAGALAEPSDRALIVFRVPNRSTVEDFAHKDPYVVNDLVKRWEVRPWKVVIGNESPARSSPGPTGTLKRLWFARTKADQLPRYLEHFSNTVIPTLHGTPGYLGASVSVHRTGPVAEVLVETAWRSLEAVRKFAGDDHERAVVTESAAALLADFDRRVRHFKIVVSDPI